MGAHPAIPAAKLGVNVSRRERRPVDLSAFAARAGGETIKMRLLDLSYEGCGVAIPTELIAGELLTLSVTNLGVVSARVRWCRDGAAGLVFEQQEQEPEEPTYWPRRSERTDIVADVLMRRRGKMNHSVQVHNLSTDGCRIEFVERPQVDENLLIKFDGLEGLDADVCWVGARTAGLRFVKPIHPAVFALLLRRLVDAA